MILHCPICNEKVKFDRYAPKAVIELFEKVGCPSLQFDHKIIIEKKKSDDNKTTSINK